MSIMISAMLIYPVDAFPLSNHTVINNQVLKLYRDAPSPVILQRNNLQEVPVGFFYD